MTQGQYHQDTSDKSICQTHVSCRPSVRVVLPVVPAGSGYAAFVRHQLGIDGYLGSTAAVEIGVPSHRTWHSRPRCTSEHDVLQQTLKTGDHGI